MVRISLKSIYVYAYELLLHFCKKISYNVVSKYLCLTVVFAKEIHFPVKTIN